MPSAAEERNLESAVEYLRAIEAGDIEAVAALAHPDIRQLEFPNRLNPKGAERAFDGIVAGMKQGAHVVRDQRYEVTHTVGQGDDVALEVVWSATLNIGLGDALPAGTVLRARFAVFLTFLDGRIVGQRNYDCFDPW